MNRFAIPRVLLLLAVAALFGPGAASGEGGFYGRTKHADPSRGVQRLTAWSVGSCEQCHAEHDGSIPYDFALFDAADNSTCLAAGCHDAAYRWPPGDYHYPWPGDRNVWSQSVHGYSTAPYPPIDGRPVSSCVQCHAPHGAGDPANGLYPSMTGQLEERGCTSRPDAAGAGCHGSDPAWRPVGAKDLATVFTRPYRHEIEATAKLHSWDWTPDFPFGKERRTAHSGDFDRNRRHVECVDCHNPHEARTGIHKVGSNAAGPTLRGSWGVEPSFGAPWSVPTVFNVVDFDAGTGNEYQLCLRCHSYFAYGNTPPASSTDQAREFNPANASVHPVAGGTLQNSYTNPTAVNGLRETMEFPWNNGLHDLMTCSDCHSSGRPEDPAGPHGSDVPGILPESAGETDNSFCLRCHLESVYAPMIDPGDAETGSRFDQQTTGKDGASHYRHIRALGIGCRECHGGSQTPGGGRLERGSLHGTNLANGLMNGTKIASYVPGSCTPTCHGNLTYTAGPQ